MPFKELEIAEHLAVVEDHFWVHRRPPLSKRTKFREAQRISKRSIELFYVHPNWNDMSIDMEASIARLQYVVSRKVWQLYWKRSAGRWERYGALPESESLIEMLEEIHADPYRCFFS